MQPMRRCNHILNLQPVGRESWSQQLFSSNQEYKFQLQFQQGMSPQMELLLLHDHGFNLNGSHQVQEYTQHACRAGPGLYSNRNIHPSPESLGTFVNQPYTPTSFSSPDTIGLHFVALWQDTHTMVCENSNVKWAWSMICCVSYCTCSEASCSVTAAQMMPCLNEGVVSCNLMC